MSRQQQQQQSLNLHDNGNFKDEVPDPEVVPQAKRRQFSAEYKERILAEAEQRTERGEIGALLRREGLYSSHLSNWRRQQRQGQLQGLAARKRRRQAKPQVQEMARLERENERLRQRLEQAELIIDVQKKLSQMLGLTTESDENK